MIYSNKRNVRILKRKRKNKKIRFIVLFSLAVILAISSISYAIKHHLNINDIYILGNEHLKNDDIISLLKIKKGDPIFRVSNHELYKRIKTSPWIKDAIIKKDLSGKIFINITESKPVAILDINNKFFLVDRDGTLLEESKEGTLTFLPVIKDIDPYNNRDTYLEAIKFINILHNKAMLYTGNVEIRGNRPEEIELKSEGFIIKIGAGDFDKKLERLSIIKEEIEKRGQPVEFIDLRFAGKAIVKTVEQKGEETKKSPYPKVNKSGNKKKSKKIDAIKKKQKKQ